MRHPREVKEDIRSLVDVTRLKRIADNYSWAYFEGWAKASAAREVNSEGEVAEERRSNETSDPAGNAAVHKEGHRRKVRRAERKIMAAVHSLTEADTILAKLMEAGDETARDPTFSDIQRDPGKLESKKEVRKANRAQERRRARNENYGEA